jgi:hypothetical protein
MVDFALETLAMAQLDIERMLQAQWAETGDTEVACKPNWKMYRQFNDHGAAILIVARQDGAAVGYLAAFIYPHPNAVGELKAEIPTYYVKEGPIRALVLSRMVDFTLEQLSARGVFKVDIETSAEHSAGRLWELKGFKLAKIGYSLKLKAMPEVKYA